MTRGRSIVIVEESARGRALVRGWQVKELMIDANIKPMYSAVAKGWVVDLARLPDLCAMCAHMGIGYRFTGAGG